MLYQNKEQFLEKVKSIKKEFTLVGLDVGASSIGLAIFSKVAELSTPYKIIFPNQLEQEIAYLQPNGIVIGSNSNITKKYFVKLLELVEKTGLPYIYQDEAYSTSIANELLKEVGLSRKKRNRVDDKLSAKLILDWFCKVN